MNKEKIKSITAWVIAGLLTALFLFSAYGKISAPENMEAMKLGDWSTIIIIGEIVSALLFLIPKTTKLGTLLLSSYMGGAIIIHMTTATGILMPSVVLILVWAVAILRNPEIICKSTYCEK
jgi:phosphatidylglycerophosphate synthase